MRYFYFILVPIFLICISFLLAHLKHSKLIPNPIDDTDYLELYLVGNNLKETPETLIMALKSPSKRVKYGTSFRISQLKLIEAQGPLLDAIENDKHMRVKIGFGQTLAKLGNEYGFKFLRQVCDNEDDIELLTLASKKLEYLRDYYCIDRLYNLYKSGSLKPEEKMMIIRSLPSWNYKILESEDQQKVMELLTDAIRDDSPDVRYHTVNIIAAVLYEDKEELKKQIRYVLSKEKDTYRIDFLEYMLEYPGPDYGRYWEMKFKGHDWRLNKSKK